MVQATSELTARAAAKRIEMDFTLDRMMKEGAHVEKACAMIGLIGLIAVGCGAGGANWSPGRSEGGGGSEGSEPASTTKNEDAGSGVWERWGELEKYEVVVPMGASRGHHVGQWSGEVRGNAIAMAGMKERGKEKMGKGAVLVEVHRGRGGESVVYAMEKREAGYNEEGGDWEYLVVEGGRVKGRGKLGGCARCHVDASVDFLFLGPNKSK